MNITKKIIELVKQGKVEAAKELASLVALQTGIAHNKEQYVYWDKAIRVMAK